MAALFDEGFRNAEIEHLDVGVSFGHQEVIEDGSQSAQECSSMVTILVGEQQFAEQFGI